MANVRLNNYSKVKKINISTRLDLVIRVTNISDRYIFGQRE